MKQIIKGTGIMMLILFFSLYFSKYNNDYYENKRILTDEAINRFEKDVKEGKKIDAKNYLPKEKDYNNKASEIGVKSSEFIEKVFEKSLRVIMTYLNSIQNE